MPDIDEIKTMLQSFGELHYKRKSSFDSATRLQLTRELTDLEYRIRSAVKVTPVPEPLGMSKLKSIAAQMTEMGFGIFADRILNQHLRHPLTVPFATIDQVRDYIRAHLDDAAIAKIPELAEKKKKWGLF